MSNNSSADVASVASNTSHANTTSINTISISQSPTDHIRFTIEDGKWICYKRRLQLGSDYDKEIVSSLPCSAEDVIAALLCNMCRDDVEIHVSRLGDVPTPVQLWYLIGMKTEAPINSLPDDVKLKIE